MKRAKRVAESRAVLSAVMMPSHANHYGSVHGGTILRLVDDVAFVVATRHARKNVVMASMDHISFDHPVNIGDIVTLRGQLSYVGHSSMDVEVEIETEKLKEGKVLKVGSAYITMVALGDEGKASGVPKLILKTSREKSKSKEILARRKRRLSA